MADQDAAAQVRAMRSVRDFERLKAAGAFEAMTPEVVEAVFAAFLREQRKWWPRVAVIFFLVFIVWASIDARLHPAAGPGIVGNLGWFVGLVLALAGGQTRLGRRLAGLLDACGDETKLDALVDGLLPMGVANHGAFSHALARALARVSGSEWVELGDSRRRRLIGVILLGPPDLSDAAMGAFLRAGDPSCRDAVGRLAKGGGAAQRDKGLRARAQVALVEFEALAAEERQVATLLRPADAPADATLLRPAGGSGAGDETKLLRPAEPDAGDDAEVTNAHG